MFEESLTNILRKSLLELLNKYLAEIIQMQCIALAELLDESLKKKKNRWNSRAVICVNFRGVLSGVPV